MYKIEHDAHKWMVKMNRINNFFKDKAAYTLFEIMVVLVLISIVSGGISAIFTASQTNYEILAEAHNIKSSLRLLQAKAMQYFEQELYNNTEMRDDDLWGIQLLRGNTLKLVRKPYSSNRVVDFNLKGPVWTDNNLYPTHTNDIAYTLINPCLNNKGIYFDALGKPVDKDGELCSKEIKLTLSSRNTNKIANIVINKTGHISIHTN